MLRVLGIDPGSRVCGYALITARPRDELACTECGVLTAPAHQAMERRLGEIARGLREVIEELAPEALAVEDVFSHANVRSALALAQARGMALAIAGLVGLPVFSYAPALVKKTVVGSGRAGKHQVARMVAGMVGLRSLPRADAADAIAVAITHMRLCRVSPARLIEATVRPIAACDGDAEPEPDRSLTVRVSADGESARRGLPGGGASVSMAVRPGVRAGADGARR